MMVFSCVSWAPRDGLAPAPGAEVNKVRRKVQLHEELLHQSPEIHHNGSLQSSYSLQQKALDPEAGRQKRGGIGSGADRPMTAARPLLILWQKDKRKRILHTILP
ncbi:uncharacterized [Tachysurus ichikawai]